MLNLPDCMELLIGGDQSGEYSNLTATSHRDSYPPAAARLTGNFNDPSNVWYSATNTLPVWLQVGNRRTKSISRHENRNMNSRLTTLGQAAAISQSRCDLMNFGQSSAYFFFAPSLFFRVFLEFSLRYDKFNVIYTILNG